MLDKATKKLIESCATNNKLVFNDLDYDERDILTANLLLADDNPVFSNDVLRAMAKVIINRGDTPSLLALYRSIYDQFISPTSPSLAYYAEQIQDLLSAACDEQNTKANEHFLYDCWKRAHDLRST